MRLIILINDLLRIFEIKNCHTIGSYNIFHWVRSLLGVGFNVLDSDFIMNEFDL